MTVSVDRVVVRDLHGTVRFVTFPPAGHDLQLPPFVHYGLMFDGWVLQREPHSVVEGQEHPLPPSPDVNWRGVADGMGDALARLEQVHALGGDPAALAALDRYRTAVMQEALGQEGEEPEGG